MEKKSNLTFIILLLALLVGYFWLGNYLWPPQPLPPQEPQSALKDDVGKDDPKKPEVKQPEPERPPVEEPGDNTPVILGGAGWHLEATVTPEGAAVRKLVLNHFQQAKSNGEPAWLDDDKKVPQKLELIPEDRNREIGSFLLHHYRQPTDEDFPLDTLGKRRWKRVEPAQIEPGQKVSRVSFATTVRGVQITKTFTLEPRAYHLGLEVKLELDAKGTEETFFRYQLTGAHGLPIEGWWYTSTMRNALIARLVGHKEIERFFQDQREVAIKGGGSEVVKGEASLRWAAIVNQYFASVIAVDPREEANRDIVAQARPLLMSAAVKGRILNDPLASGQVDLLGEDEKTRHTFVLRSAEKEQERITSQLTTGAKVIVVYRPDVDLKGNASNLLTDVLDATKDVAHFHDDLTVVISTAKERSSGVRLKPGVPVVHKYVLYNGPVKVKLLEQLKLDEAVDGHAAGADAVDESLVTFYRDELYLRTLTDYRSPGWLSEAVSWTPWTTIIIFFTNLCHTLLYWLSSFAPYGICIVLLTVIVRGLMHPVSRKMARTSMRMQELAPELKKLQEKHKGDRQALSVATMELYRKHGVNPLGSCWIVLLQMPVFMGLYFALQESIHFRLKPFLWISNLAAPDMLIRWGESIPWLSSPESYGGFLYLGPYFNLLPIIAVALMIVQQKMTMPPPADEQQEMQMKMMKYMMIVMGLMFYKVAAGLAIYFIASSAWGFAERKLLPKKKPDGAAGTNTTAGQGMLQKLLGQTAATPSVATANGPALPATTPPLGGKKKRNRDRREGAASATQETSVSGWWAQMSARLRNWWQEVLRQAEKR